MSDQRARQTIFAVFPGCEILDLAGPAQAFHEATALGARYTLAYHAVTPTVRTAQGLELGNLKPLPDVGLGVRIIVPCRTRRRPRRSGSTRTSRE
jgi:transcriptional regulator GlxA family with amidase domain